MSKPRFNFPRMASLLATVRLACKDRTPNPKAAKELQGVYDDYIDRADTQLAIPELVDDVEFVLIQYYESLGMT